MEPAVAITEKSKQGEKNILLKFSPKELIKTSGSIAVLHSYEEVCAEVPWEFFISPIL